MVFTWTAASWELTVHCFETKSQPHVLLSRYNHLYSRRGRIEAMFAFRNNNLTIRCVYMKAITQYFLLWGLLMLRHSFFVRLSESITEMIWPSFKFECSIWETSERIIWALDVFTSNEAFKKCLARCPELHYDFIFVGFYFFNL